MQGDY
jgi:14-3-3 protein epsilon